MHKAILIFTSNFEYMSWKEKIDFDLIDRLSLSVLDLRMGLEYNIWSKQLL